MKYLGLDIGTKRVGVSISDDAGKVAFPVAQVGRDECVAYVRKIVSDRSIGTVVIGNSLDLDGEENIVMRDVRSVADEVKVFASVVFAPEQFSTQAAARLGKGSDAEAATIILQGYLDGQNVSGDEDEDIIFD